MDNEIEQLQQTMTTTLDGDGDETGTGNNDEEAPWRTFFSPSPDLLDSLVRSRSRYRSRSRFEPQPSSVELDATQFNADQPDLGDEINSVNSVPSSALYADVADPQLLIRKNRIDRRLETLQTQPEIEKAETDFRHNDVITHWGYHVPVSQPQQHDENPNSETLGQSSNIDLDYKTYFNHPAAFLNPQRQEFPFAPKDTYDVIGDDDVTNLDRLRTTYALDENGNERWTNENMDLNGKDDDLNYLLRRYLG